MSRKKKRIPRRRANAFKEQGGLCFWCKVPMVMTSQHGKVPIKNGCTLDHLDDRYSHRRGKHPRGSIRTVAACWQCNQDRNVKREKEIGLAEIRKRASHGIWGCSPQ